MPNKNITLIAGKPLIAYSVEQARKSGLFSTVAISSDSDEILECARKAGATVLIKRPDDLAGDTAAKLPVIQHCIAEAEKLLGVQFDTVVDLDCTSPLRNVEDIVGAVKTFEDSEAENLISGAVARRSPYFNLVKLTDSGYVSLAAEDGRSYVRRQDAPRCFDMNASIYVWSRRSLLACKKVIGQKTILFEMPEERSIDIDSAFDLEIVSYLLRKKEATYV